MNSRQHFLERLDRLQAVSTTEVSNEVNTVQTILKYRLFQCTLGATNQNADFILHHSHLFTSKSSIRSSILHYMRCTRWCSPRCGNIFLEREKIHSNQKISEQKNIICFLEISYYSMLKTEFK